MIMDCDVFCLRNNAWAMLYRRLGSLADDNTNSWRYLWQFTTKI